MTTTGQKRLTRLVKRFLDIAWFILLAAVIIWPIVTVGVGLNLFFDQDVRDVTVYLGFEIHPDSPEAATVSADGKEALIRGRSEVQVEARRPLDTSNTELNIAQDCTPAKILHERDNRVPANQNKPNYLDTFGIFVGERLILD